MRAQKMTLCCIVALALVTPACKHATSAKTASSAAATPVVAPTAAKPGPTKQVAKEQPAAQPPKLAKPPQSVDTKDLDESELKIFTQIIDDQFDPCGKPRSFRKSLDDGDCALSRRLGRFIVHKLQQGYGKRKIVKLLLREIERINTIVQVDVKGAPVIGPPDSKVKVVIFSDFECPFCRRTAKPLKQLQEHYKFALFYKHYPLKASHPHAEGAAMAAWAAQQQGKFWPMHDTLFEHAPDLAWKQVRGYAAKLGLDMKRFDKEARSKEAKAAVTRDYTHGGDADVDGTPTFFVNGRRAETLRQLQDAIREQMSLTGSTTLPAQLDLGDSDNSSEENSAPKQAAANERPTVGGK